MRYSCPSCNRVFHLEAEVASLCPACGTKLELSEDQAADDAQAAPGAQAQGESWLMDTADGAPVDAGEIASPAAGPSEATAAATAWLPGGEGGEEAAPEEEPEGTEPSAAATQVMPAVRPSRETRRLSAVMAAGGAPTGMKLLVATTASILVTLVIAVVVIVLLPKKKTPTDVADTVGVSTGSEAAEIARLEIAVKDLREEAAKYKEERNAIRSERDTAEAELAKTRGEAEGLKTGLSRRGEATRKTLAALELLERRVELAEAMKLTGEALRAEPSFVQAHRLRGRILAATGRAEEALGAFEKADKAARELGEGGDVTALVLAGELALTDLAAGGKALAYYKRAVDLKTDSAYGLVAEARVLMLNGTLSGAGAKAAAAEKKDPSLALAPLVGGEVAYRESARKDWAEPRRRALRKKADELLARALRLDPNSTRACVARGRVLIDEARLASAGRGFGLRRLGQQAQAENLLSKALKLSPKLPEIHTALAELLLGEGALRDAAVARIRAKEAVRLTGEKDAYALATLAAAQRASGDPEAAAGTMERAVKLEPKNTDYREMQTRYRMEAEALKR